MNEPLFLLKYVKKVICWENLKNLVISIVLFMSFVWYFGGAVVGGGGCVGTCDVCVVVGVGTYGIVLFVSLLLLIFEIPLEYCIKCDSTYDTTEEFHNKYYDKW